MTAAIALAVVLAIAVAGASMAMESQKSGAPAGRRPVRPDRPTRTARTSDTDPTRRPLRRRDRPKPSVPASEASAPPPPPAPEPELKGPDLRRSGTAAQAKVISVVDERTIGPVTRSRLVLLIEPAGSDPIEVTVRHAFPTPDSRATVKVGGSVPVRYDPEEPRRVVVDLPQG